MHSRWVKENIKNIFLYFAKYARNAIIGYCKRIQRVNEAILPNGKDTVVQCQPCNSRPKGKVKRSHRILKKLKYHLTWSLNLPNYMTCLNNEKRKEQDWHSAFELDFGRKINELVFYGLPNNRGSPVLKKVSKPTRNDFNIFEKLHLKTRKEVLDSDKRVAKRTVENLRKRMKYSAYKINQKVMVRYEKKERKHLKDGFRDLVNNQKVWYSLDDTADLQVQANSNKKKLVKSFTKESELLKLSEYI